MNDIINLGQSLAKIIVPPCALMWLRYRSFYTGMLTSVTLSIMGMSCTVPNPDFSDDVRDESILSVAGEEVAGEDRSGGSSAGEEVAGEQIAGTQVAGTQVAGTQVAGTQVAG